VSFAHLQPSAGAGLLGAVALAGVGIPTAYLPQSLMPTRISRMVVGHAYGLDSG
jgi:hypothetical protein